MPESDNTRPDNARITLEDATVTWRTLMTVAENWHGWSDEWASLVAARRLVEIEVREQHGDLAWAQLTREDEDDG